MLLAALVMLAVEQFLVASGNRGIGHSGFVRAGAVAVGVLGLGGLVVVLVRDRPTVSSAGARLVAVWRDPPGDWVAIVLGALLAIPLLRLYAPVLFSDADSARLVAAVTHVHAHGIGYLIDTQDNLLPQVLLGPVIAVSGLAGAKLFAIASVQVLAGVTAYLTRRITGSMWGAAAAAIALVALPPILERAIYLPMYPTMLALGYAGAWLAYRTIVLGSAAGWWRYVVPAGVFLALTPEAQAVGQLFYVAPLLLIVFAPSLRSWFGSVARIYAVVLVVSLPRIVINLSEGGLSRFTSYRTDYWINEGYVREIQIKFYHYKGVDDPLGHYVHSLPGWFLHALAGWGWLFLLLSGVAWLVWCRGRARWFVLGVVGFLALAVTIMRAPPAPRYYSPLFPGIALLVGFGVGRLAAVRLPLPSLSRALVRRVVGGLCVAALAAVALINLGTVARQDDRFRLDVERSPYPALAAAIDDGKGVIGARSGSLVFVTADIATWGGQFLSEDEYVTYLTWPSDEQVITMLERHDIGWVLIGANRGLEKAYHNIWLVPNYGLRARQVDAVAASPRFCKVMSVRRFILYRLGACPG